MSDDRPASSNSPEPLGIPDTPPPAEAPPPEPVSQEPEPAEPAVDEEVPPPPPVDPVGEGETPLEHIVDDVEPRAEAQAWAYMEMRRGRVAEDVYADLVARGWDEDEAEGLVEQARKEARYAPGAVRAAAGAMPQYRPRGGILGAIINLLVGLFSAIFAGPGGEDPEVTMRRTDRIRRGLCAKCGYDLKGSNQPCPNCGTHPPPR